MHLTEKKEAHLPMPSLPGNDHMPYRLVIVFLLLLLGIGLSGYLYHDSQQRRISKDIQYELKAITDLKVSQIVSWRGERLGDANGISQTGFVAARAQAFMNDPGAPGLQEDFLTWMRSFQSVNKYRSILLTDTKGRVLLSTAEGETSTRPQEKSAMLDAFRNQRAVLSDIHRPGAGDYTRLDLFAPLFIRLGKEALPVGAYLLRIDPNQFLYPLIQAWPTPSKSAETLLFRRDGNDAVLLNEPRHNKNMALTFRLALDTNPELSDFLDRRESGIIETSDYRGVPVIAAVQPVPETSWFLVSKIDQEEVYAPLRRQAVLMLIVLALLVAAAGMSIVFWWRQKTAVHLRKQYEAELEHKALSQRYEYLSRHANDIIMLIDSAGKITEANKRAETAYGYAHEELLRHNIRDLRPPETHHELASQMQHIREREGFVFETVHRRKDGTTFPVEVSSTFIDLDGRKYFQSIIRDITERRQAEDALKNSEARYRELTGLLPQTVFEMDEKGNFTFSNKFGFDTFGYSQEDIDRGLNVLHMLVAEDRERAKANIQRVLAGGSAGPNEYAVTGLDGIRRDVIIYSAPIMRNNRSMGLRGIVMDITERKDAERALQESKHRYKRLIESVTDYIYTVEIENGRAASTYHGPGCIAVTGYTSEEYQAAPDLWFRMIHENDRQRVLEQVERVLAGEAAASFEHRIIHKSGALRWVRNTPVPRHDASGRLIAYDGLISDITQLKLLENQLRQAQKMEAVGQLAGGVAHDFNNILTAIIGYANLLLMKVPPDGLGRSYVEQILTSSERAAHLTHSLLAFSRKQLMDLRPVDVNDIIRRVEKLLVRVIGEDIEFKTRLCEAEATVLADGVQLEQVLMNLATNARDAMPRGGYLEVETDRVELDEAFVKAHAHGSPGSYARITVTDTGTGMEETVKSRIFEPFFTTKDVGKGTGLGLAMVYGIVKQHNGYIHLYSEPGRGSAFKIYLPCIVSSPVRQTEQKSDDVTGGVETVLLAEDDGAVRALSRSVLEGYGYRVIEAVDGEDAICKCRENNGPIDLLVLDIIMPKKNGKDACDDIRKIRPDVKVLFTSGYTADIVHQKGIMDEGFDFLVKPSTPALFLKKVREVLDRQDTGLRNVER